MSQFFWYCFHFHTRQKCQVFISSWSPKHDSKNNHQSSILITWAIPPPQMFPRFSFPKWAFHPPSDGCLHGHGQYAFPLVIRVLYLKTFLTNFSCVHQMLYLSFIASYPHSVCFWLLLTVGSCSVTAPSLFVGLPVMLSTQIGSILLLDSLWKRYLSLLCLIKLCKL